VPDVTETLLPGLGVRHDFTTSQGEQLAVLVLRSGRRELVVYDRHDPDTARATLRLDTDDARTLAELLGATQVSQSITELQQIEGIAIDWLNVAAESAFAGRTIGDAALRTRTGVSIVAIIREGGQATIPAPGPEEALRAGDVAVAVGTPDGLAAAFKLLQSG
jgi:TrkA domain protein